VKPYQCVKVGSPSKQEVDIMNTTEHITNAIKNGHRLKIYYEPGIRIIEPHTVGYSGDNNLLLRAYQTEGASASGEHEHWKLFRVDRIGSVTPTNAPSEAPRPGYKRGDKGMRGGIISEL
jgi:predicted DNA-binding transcriptional regulator YafY